MTLQRSAVLAGLLLIAIFLIVGAASPALAAKGGVKGKPGGGGGGGGDDSGGGSSTVTLIVTPTPVQAHNFATLSGSGYAPGVKLWIEIEQNWCCAYTQIMPNPDGTFSLAFRTRDPGTYYARVSHQSSKRKFALLSSVSFAVVG